MTELFNSRNPDCKSPFGAVASGTAVTLSIRAPRALSVSEAILCAAFEFDRQTQETVMSWTGLDGDHDRYTATLSTKSRLGPVWYYFTLRRYNKPTVYIGCNTLASDGGGVLSEELPPGFLLNIYDKSYEVPGWYGEGVTYHIFPDRFRRTSLPNTKGLTDQRIVHENWDDIPEYRPDENGEILNNDFFGGSISGVQEKLPYLQSLGVTTIYFSPIFEAGSNHRYDTSDYHAIDPMFGDEVSFKALCKEAESLGMRVMLDGVFSHTGYDSRYFNGRGTYPELGAYQSKDSPYYSWYDFTEWPDAYSSWWGIYTLPQVVETDPSYMAFILGGQDSVIRRWLRAGASGWRLDVADELPDEFIARLRDAARTEKPDAVIIGEVWEDATTKVAYDRRRKYLLGHELDGVMNYPLRDALLDYLLHGDASKFKNRMETLRENYPKPAYYSLMNILGTHDTPRTLTVLGVDSTEYEKPRNHRAEYRLTPEARSLAVRRLKMGALIQFSFPGSPCIYYGDEAGMEGFEDPFNRRGYPWGHEDQKLIAWYTRLGQLRKKLVALKTGDIRYLCAKGSLLAFERIQKNQRVVAVVNAGETESCRISIPWKAKNIQNAMTGECFPVANGHVDLLVPPLTGLLFI